jgi:hypothetical protein
MEKSYNNSPQTNDEKISQLLSSMPKMEASENFNETLMANIRKIDDGQDVSLLRKVDNSRSYWIAALSTAAGLALAIFMFNMGDSNTSIQDQAPTLAKEKSLEAASDSVKNEKKNFNRPVNLVGDKKKSN